jgi:hypothetical protein
MITLGQIEIFAAAIVDADGVRDKYPVVEYEKFYNTDLKHYQEVASPAFKGWVERNKALLLSIFPSAREAIRSRQAWREMTGDELYQDFCRGMFIVFIYNRLMESEEVDLSGLLGPD